MIGNEVTQIVEKIKAMEWDLEGPEKVIKSLQSILNMTKIKRIDIKEFQETGFLQEVNRQFLHPLGLALEVIVDNDSGEVKLGGVWDYRDDPEGMYFADDTIDSQKVVNVRALWDEKERARIERFGWVIQPDTNPREVGFNDPLGCKKKGDR